MLQSIELCNYVYSLDIITIIQLAIFLLYSHYLTNQGKEPKA